ncbi:hypothetical protein AB0G04_41965 [Actinoplanes sp. NPDC023801]|uniref:hypothetical protein n=1 Tax=Actinoplanes sp. NPDC023801 TaxID=3154595 RepID=UPI0033D21506
MNTVRGRAFAWLAHPVTVVALALLIVNDHVLKAAYPGWVTGKLSDVAGMVLAPPLLAALAGLIAPRLAFRRLAVVAIVAVGAGFTFVKLWSYGAELASATWSLLTPSLVRADPTDLLALPFLAVARWTADRPASRRWLRALRLAVVLPVALFGVAATSSDEPRESSPSARVVTVGGDGGLYLGAVGPGRNWSVSRDGARTWVEAEEPSDAEPVPCTGRGPSVCYRVVSGELAVQSDRGDARWPDSWRIDERDRRGLEKVYRTGDLSSVSLSVVDVPGGHVVVVANGRDGFAVRDRLGVWTRIGFPGLPASVAPATLASLTPQPEEEPDSPGFALAFLIGGLVLTAVPVWRLWQSGAGVWWWALFLPLNAAAVLTVLLDPTVAAGVTLATGLICPAVAMVGARVRATSVLGAFLLVAAAMAVSFLLWLGISDREVGSMVVLMALGGAAVTPAVAKVMT